MKNLLILLTLTVTLSCCNKDDDKPISAIDQLPPATTTGTNKLGCLVNGEVFLPHQNNPFGSPAVTCYYQNLNGSYEFGLGFSNDQQSNLLPSIDIFTNKLQFVQGQTYNLTLNQPTNSAYAHYSPDYFLEGYGTNTQIIGELKITKLDETSAIISGTFWFDAIKASNGEIIHIREGRFDMEYSQ